MNAKRYAKELSIVMLIFATGISVVWLGDWLGKRQNLATISLPNTRSQFQQLEPDPSIEIKVEPFAPRQSKLEAMDDAADDIRQEFIPETDFDAVKTAINVSDLVQALLQESSDGRPLLVDQYTITEDPDYDFPLVEYFKDAL